MKVGVDAKYLVKLFTDFVKNTKVMFNFKVNGNIINIQMIGDYTACVDIPVKSLDNDFSTVDISFWVTKAIGILDKDKPITLTFTDAVMFMEQDDFSATFIKEHEERRSLPDVSEVEFKPAYAKRLKYLTHAAVSCNGLAKELAIPEPDPVFANGKFYCDYRQSFFIDNMLYPEMCIALSTLRDFAYKLDDDTEFAYLQELNTACFKSGIYTFWIPTNNHNISSSIINAIDKKLQECEEVTKLCFKEYMDKLTVISSAFPKQKMTLLIGNGMFNISVSNNDMQCTVGNKMNSSLLGINVTSAQVATIAKLFKDDDTVECLRGGNCICLKSGEKNMLIAGMIY